MHIFPHQRNFARVSYRFFCEDRGCAEHSNDVERQSNVGSDTSRNHQQIDNKRNQKSYFRQKLVVHSSYLIDVLYVEKTWIPRNDLDDVD